jgi:hypothetical protein
MGIPVDLAKEIKNVSEIYAEAVRDYATAYHARKIKGAELTLQFKRNPPPDIKVTDTVAEALIEIDPEYIRLKKVENEADYKRVLARGLYEAGLAGAKMLGIHQDD